MSESLTKPLATAILGTLVGLLMPGAGGVVSAALDAVRDSFRRRALETWAAELADHGVTTDEITEDAKVFAAYTVVGAVLRAQTHERIGYFAKLHANFAKGIVRADEFKEFVGLLEDLSEREFQMLLMLDESEEKGSSVFYATVYPAGQAPTADRSGASERRDDKRRLVHSQNFWEPFREEAVRRFDLSEDEIANVVQRLARTGLCQVLQDSSGGVLGASTTPYFRRFVAGLLKCDRDGQPLEKTISIKPFV
jgi:hypothetical protein